MDKLKELLVSFLSKTLSIDSTGVAELFESDGTTLKPTALQALLDKDIERVSTLTQGKFDEGVKKATKDVLTAFEREVKTKFGLSIDKKGLELIEAVVEAKSKKGDAPTEEQIKTSRTYLDLSEGVDRRIADAVAAEQKKHDDYKATVERGNVISKVKEKALTILDSLKPILSTDPIKAQNQKNFFLGVIESGNYRIEGDRIILLNPDGTTEKVDAHNKRIDFEAFAKTTAEGYYDFQAADQRGGAGAGAGGAGGAGAGGTKTPKTVEEYSSMMSEAGNDATKRAEVTKLWLESQETAGK